MIKKLISSILGTTLVITSFVFLSGIDDNLPVDQDYVETVVETNQSELQPKTIKTVNDVSERPDETIFTTMGSQGNAPWGLDVIDGVRDGTYNYVSDGAGVRIYIVDTGVDASHREFGSRVADGFDAFGQNLDQTDCHGHGTHVAGIAAGSYFGVAKAATIVPVRVMDCNGIGNTTTLTRGINWILDNHPGGFGVVNMSIGGNKDSEVDAVVGLLVSAGLVVVAAAGNSNSDACNFSPASAVGVTAVGAIDQNNNKSSFSNWGPCVDISAPGTSINSANASNHGVSLRMSGTSQAAPFAAGAIATYFSSGVVSSGTGATSYLSNKATNGIVTVDVELRSEPEPTQEPAPEPEPEPEPVAVEPEPEPIVVNIYAEQRRKGSGFVNISWDELSDVEEFEIYSAPLGTELWKPMGSANGEARLKVVPTKLGSHYIFKVVAKMKSGIDIELGTVVYSSN